MGKGGGVGGGKQDHDLAVRGSGKCRWREHGKATWRDTLVKECALSPGGDGGPLTAIGLCPWRVRDMADGALPLRLLGKMPRVSLAPGLEPRLGYLPARAQPVPAAAPPQGLTACNARNARNVALQASLRSSAH